MQTEIEQWHGAETNLLVKNYLREPAVYFTHGVERAQISTLYCGGGSKVNLQSVFPQPLYVVWNHLVTVGLFVNSFHYLTELDLLSNCIDNTDSSSITKVVSNPVST